MKTGKVIFLACVACAQPGAPAAESNMLSAKADWWSFRPAVRPELPRMKNSKWARNPIDLFILAKLEQEHLSPSPEADPRTLIRRLSFDLTGLPPTPDEAAQFATDRSPQAYEKLVDRLLESPRYGERWARHWLDTVHFADTHGYDKDKTRPNAWPYRDYVIRAFNEDKPYSRFVEEQLAGDVLFPDEPDGVVALGFIAAGPWDFVGHVELSIEKTDGLIARYNDRDDMLMNAMSTFQSLTVHCARCHDHKFDPITQRDYYSLQAVFAGVDRHDRPFDSDKKTHAQRRLLRQKQKALEERLATITNQIAQISSAEMQEVDAQMAALKKRKGDGEKSPGNGYHSAIEKTQDVTKWVQIDLGKSLPLEEVRLVPARPVDFADTPGFGFPVRFRVEVSDESEFVSPLTITDRTKEDFRNPADNVVRVPAGGQRARFVRITATRLWERTSDYVFALAELQALVSGTNAALGCEVSALDSIEAGLWSKRFLVDGFDSRRDLAKAGSLEAEIQALREKRYQLAMALLDESTRVELIEVSNRLVEVSREIGALPPPQQVYAAASDFKPGSNFLPPKTPRPVYLLARGDVKRPGELMQPAAIAAVPGPEPRFDVSDRSDESARRVALAKWITDPRNMLTRRSIVNRVWHYHFGRGIVETPNDFGHMGAQPTHPELLDWLAFWFLENGESLKKLHRLIATSATYRQSSQVEREKGRKGERENVPPAPFPPFSLSARAQHAMELDADNRLLWRMNRSRLDSESIHDAMLFISGKLDLAMGGPAIQQFYFKDDHSPVYDYTQFDVNSPASCRRSIYRFVVRSVPDPLMEALDCPNASILTPKRNVTTTSLQALAILNDPFVLKQCEHFAARVANAGDFKKQIERSYQLALNRRPTVAEMKRLVPFAQKHGMANVCRVIFNSSEFMFVD